MKKSKLEILIGLIIAAAVVTAIVIVVRFDITGDRGSGLSKDFVYDITDKLKIDPNLILYTQSAEALSTGFSKSMAIATDSAGNIYVTGEKGVRVFDINGDFQKQIELTGSPRCITVAKDGKIFIGMKDHVQVVDGQAWQSLNADAVLTSIAVYKNDVFVADAGNRIVLRYDTDGKLINRIGEKDKDKNIPGFVIPSPYFDLAVASDGLLRVVNPGRHRIEAYTFDGDLEFWWGSYSANVEGFCGCCNPVNFAILNDGSFVTCEKGLVRIKVYDADGKFVGVVAGPEQLIQDCKAKICEVPALCQVGGFDLAVDIQQRILVLDTVKNKIKIFTKKK
ncbi:hypothetical protein ACFL3G_08855 [Planctomycetota bacterium]